MRCEREPVDPAEDGELRRTVALKMVRPELASDPNSMDRLKQEILLASRVSHKNILRIHDLGDVGGLKFISMAYVDGKDLHQIIAAEGKLEIPPCQHQPSVFRKAFVDHVGIRSGVNNVLAFAKENERDIGLAVFVDHQARAGYVAHYFLPNA